MEIVKVDISADIEDVSRNNVLVAVPCGGRAYVVNCFARDSGTIHVGSILYATEAREGRLLIVEDEGMPSFQQDVADLQGVIGLVRDWHESR